MEKKEKSIAQNSVYYMIYQVFNVLFPFITGMYVARMLLPTANGVVSYAFNISGYFSTFAFLGIPTYGLREIAKVRHNKEELSRVFSELVVINTISTMCFGVMYLILIFSVSEFRDKLTLYLVTGGSIAFNFLNISWLFEGLEEFRYISIRNIFFKGMCIVLLFIFVKGPEDYLKYAIITVLGTAGNYILNVFYSPKFVKFTFDGLNLKRHMKPIMALVAVNLAIELYTMVDTTMLGIFAEYDNVSYYTYAQRINRILLQVINSFTMVIVPRLSLLYKQEKQEQFNSLISKTLQTIFALGIPIIVGLQVIARDAVVLIYGIEFERSASVLRMLSVLLLVSPIGYLLGSRVLLVTNHENKMVLCVGLGAIVNIIGNAILIPLFSEIGASVASIISEICVMIIYISFGKKYFKVLPDFRDCIKIIIGAAAMVAAIIPICLLVDKLIFKVILVGVSGAVIYFALLYVFKEKMVYEYGNKFFKKLKIIKES